jgi:gentisate 1,2-dioxygenase
VSAISQSPGRASDSCPRLIPSTTSTTKTSPARANVEDTPELVAYYDEGRLEKKGAGALWTVANKIEPWEPVSQSVPMIWRYADLRDDVLRSVELVTPEKAGRRVIYLNNPGRSDVAAAVGWIYAGLQVMHPGEQASAHRHSASAIRFIMEGSGAYTVVDGHKMTLGANDFVLTPNGTWHEHAVEAETAASASGRTGWTSPSSTRWRPISTRCIPDLTQAVAYPVDDMTKTWGNPGLTPGGGAWDKGYSPMFKYEWDRTYEALSKLAGASDGSPLTGS